MKLIYDGPHEAVEVPHDLATGGLIVAERGKVVEIPDEIAEGLLDQGRSENPDEKHDCPWRKPTPKQSAAAEPTTIHESAKGGD